MDSSNLYNTYKRHIINTVSSGLIDVLLIKDIYDLLVPVTHSEDSTAYMWDLNTVDNNTIEQVYHLITKKQQDIQEAQRTEQLEEDNQSKLKKRKHVTLDAIPTIPTIPTSEAIKDTSMQIEEFEDENNEDNEANEEIDLYADLEDYNIEEVEDYSNDYVYGEIDDEY